MDFITALRRERRYIYLTTALAVFACVCLIYAAHEFAWYSLLLLLLSAGFLAAFIFAVRKHREQTAEPVVSDAPEGMHEKLFDRFARRSVVWLLIVLLQVLAVVLGVVHMSFYYSALEILGNQVEGAVRLLFCAFF